MIAIFTDKIKAQEYSDLIHSWLIRNRKDYNAERWSDAEINKSDKAIEYYVKVPYDYEILNAKLEPEDRLTISEDATSIVEKLPEDWRIIEHI